MTPQETAICMGFDAMRLCMGMSTETFTEDEVLRWIFLMRTSQSPTAQSPDACAHCGQQRLSIPRLGIVSSCLLDPSKSVYQCEGAPPSHQPQSEK